MADLIEGRSHPVAPKNSFRPTPTVLRFTVATLFLAMLFGVAQASGQWSYTVAATAGFATAVTLIAAAFIGWERQVATAESAGLVKQSDQHSSRKG